MAGKTILATAILVLIIVGISYFLFTPTETQETEETNTVTEPKITRIEIETAMEETIPVKDDEFLIIPEHILEQMYTMTYQYSGMLEDVNGGTTTGTANMSFVDNRFLLYTTFTGLPAPEEGYFYEGWIVQQEPFEFISTGKVNKIAGQYRNIYSSSNDLTNHTFYVLTIEPDDRNPAPAAHIMEGTMTIN